MIKKIISLLLFINIICGVAFANITPVNTNDIPKISLGLYQVDKELIVYEKPNTNSKIILKETIDYNDNGDIKYTNQMAIYDCKKELSYLYVTDYDEEWIQVIIDKTKKTTGWVQKEDEFQFLPWVNFYGMYGRKYGLIPLKKLSKYELYSQSNEQSQLLATVTRPQMIKLTAIEGIWALVSILDKAGQTYTGYIKWRTQNGEYYLFPDIK